MDIIAMLQDDTFTISAENMSFDIIVNCYIGEVDGYGLQLNSDEKRDEVKKTCFEIYDLIKKLKQELK